MTFVCFDNTVNVVCFTFMPQICNFCGLGNTYTDDGSLLWYLYCIVNVSISLYKRLNISCLFCTFHFLCCAFVLLLYIFICSTSIMDLCSKTNKIWLIQHWSILQFYFWGHHLSPAHQQDIRLLTINGLLFTTRCPKTILGMRAVHPDEKCWPPVTG